MKCPSCNFVCPDDVRFCLECGRFLGEPEEATRVRPRIVPPTTIRADFNPAQFQPQLQDEPPRRFPRGVVLLLLAAGMLVVGLAIGMFTSRYDWNGTRAIVAATPTPYSPLVRATPSSTSTAAPTRMVMATPTALPTIQQSQAMPREIEQPTQPQRQTYVPLPSPTTPDVPVSGHPDVVINWANTMKDGAWISWEVPAGLYQLSISSSPDGAAAEWSGTENCDFKTREVTLLNQRCKLRTNGHLTVSNPTRFGLGAACYVTVKLTRF